MSINIFKTDSNFDIKEAYLLFYKHNNKHQQVVNALYWITNYIIYHLFLLEKVAPYETGE